MPVIDPTTNDIFGLAEVIAAALQAGIAEEALPAASASAQFVPIYTPSELTDNIYLTVVAKETDEVLIARGPVTQETYLIDVAVQKRLAKTDSKTENLDAIKAMMTMTKKVKDFLKGKNYTAGGTFFQWIKTINAPIYSVEHIKMGFFTSVLTLTFRVIET